MKILLKKQRKAIERLEKEKSELLTTLECWKGRGNELKEEKMTEELKRLLVHHDSLEQQIKYEKSQLNELEFQIKKVSKEVERIKKKFKVKETYYEELQEEQRTQQQLENRLDVVGLMPRGVSMRSLNNDNRSIQGDREIQPNAREQQQTEGRNRPFAQGEDLLQSHLPGPD